MIRIIAVGKIKDSFIVSGINEYQKRINGMTKFQITEVKEYNNKTIIENITSEGLEILKNINSDEYVITLEIKGDTITSEMLADKIVKLQCYNHSKITFIIGGSNGLSDDVKKRSNYALSFSSFTFPHQLMRLILVEQLYRAFTIINNQEYHK